MLKLHATTYKKCFTTLLFILFFIGLLPPNLNGQVKIKERVELIPSKGIESYTWPYNGCTYEVFDTNTIYLKFEPNQIGPGSSTIMRVFTDELYQNPYTEDSLDQVLLKNITLEPNYGTCTRLGYGVYAIAIPDTVTSDSVLVTINYELFHHGCWHWEKQSIQTITMENNDNLTCLDCTFPDYSNLVRCTGSEQLIIKPDSFVVYIDPAECYPGDTVQVVIKKRNADGTLADFTPEQTYEIAKLEGCMLGNILANNDSGSYFYDVSQPIYFAAADSLVGDSTGTVLLKVGLMPNQKKELPADHRKVIESNDCYYGSFVVESFKLNSFPIHKYTLTILSPMPDTTFWVSDEPHMPTIECQAKVNDYHKGKLTFEWEFWVGYDYLRREINETDTLCRRVSRVVLQGKSYSYNNQVSYWTVPFDKDSLKSFKIISPKPRRPSSPSYGGDCEAITTIWDGGEEVFTGGDIYIKVFAKNDRGWIIAENELNKKDVRLKGKNANVAVFKQYLNSKEIEAIMLAESESEHFTTSNTPNKNLWPYETDGFPLYGEPNGYGLLQLDNPPPDHNGSTENQLWNWKAHIDFAKTAFNIYKSKALEHLSGHIYPAEYLLQSTYQLYNGRHLYIWGTDGWYINPKVPVNRLYKKLANGTKIYKQYGFLVYEYYKTIP
ncbi:MAG: hypothetical protein WAU11_08330 [Ignavibacteriaceae bacterium]